MTIRIKLHALIVLVFLISSQSIFGKHSASPSFTLISSAPVQTGIEIRVDPNPAIDNFTVKSNITYGSIQLFNIIGKPLKEFKASADHNYNIGDLPGGIYLIRFFDDHGQVLKTVKLYKRG